jgi:hypothetical protein
MGAKCNAAIASDNDPMGPSGMPCSMFMNGPCYVDGLQASCTYAANLLGNDEFEVMNIPVVMSGYGSAPAGVSISGYSSTFTSTGNSSNVVTDPTTGQASSLYTLNYNWGVTTWSATVGNGSWLLVAGANLPPGMNGGYWAARNAAERFMQKPIQNPPGTPGPPEPPPDLGGWDEEAMKILELATHGLMEMREVMFAFPVMPKVQSCMILQNCGPEL